MKRVDVFIKNVAGLVVPQQAHKGDAGYDVIAMSDPQIVGESVNDIGYTRIDYIEYLTNLYIEPRWNYDDNKYYRTLLHPRSSISGYNLILKNSIGLVDFSFRGNVACRFAYIMQPEDLTIIQTKLCDGENNPEHNFKIVNNVYVNINKDKIYKKGDKICQLVVEENVEVDFHVVQDLRPTIRGIGGFGSTGQ